MPPPTYNEAFDQTSIKEDAEDDEHTLVADYKPLYPTFVWSLAKDSQ